MRARVFVTLKPSVFDPQGKTIADALHSLGYGSVEDVRRKLTYDLEYIRRQSALEDLRIMLRTLPAVLFKQGGW